MTCLFARAVGLFLIVALALIFVVLMRAVTLPIASKPTVSACCARQDIAAEKQRLPEK